MPVVTQAEYLEIDGTPLATPAWFVENLPELRSGAQTRGTDRLIPGAAGALPKPRRVAPTPAELHLVIFGTVDVEGGAYSDYRAGLDANIDYLQANVVDPPATTTGVRPATLHLADGTTRTADVQVEKFDVGVGGPDSVLAVLRITIVQGRFT